MRFEIRGVAQFFQCRFLLRIQLLRGPHTDLDQLVAFFIGVHCREPFSFQAEYFTTLGAGRNLDLGPAINGGHFHLRTKYGIGE